MLARLFIYSAFIISAGCVTTPSRNVSKIHNVDWPLAELRAVAASVLPIGQRAISPNGRELLSKHFIPEGEDSYKPAGDAVERYFASILILGDRRPYDIEVQVTYEKRVVRGNRHTYVAAGYDPLLAKEIEAKLQAELTKRREDLNIIDDFRVF